MQSLSYSIVISCNYIEFLYSDLYVFNMSFILWPSNLCEFPGSIGCMKKVSLVLFYEPEIFFKNIHLCTQENQYTYKIYETKQKLMRQNQILQWGTSFLLSQRTWTLVKTCKVSCFIVSALFPNIRFIGSFIYVKASLSYTMLVTLQKINTISVTWTFSFRPYNRLISSSGSQLHHFRYMWIPLKSKFCVFHHL